MIGDQVPSIYHVVTSASTEGFTKGVEYTSTKTLLQSYQREVVDIGRATTCLIILCLIPLIDKGILVNGSSARQGRSTAWYGSLIAAPEFVEVSSFDNGNAGAAILCKPRGYS